MGSRFWFAILFVLVSTSAGSAAHAKAGPLPANSAAPVSSRASSTPMLSIAPAANDAVQVVNEFMWALSTGDLATARRFLDPATVVISNGVIYGNRDAYLSGPAKSDAVYLQKSQRKLLRRQARAGATFAWVISEKLLRIEQDKTSVARVNTETMLLAKGAGGWKIVHINWSSRAAANQ
jgi:hypothetical protein